MSPTSESRTAALLAAVEQGVQVYDLARPYGVGMPQSPNHPAFFQSFARRHGELRRDDGTSSANDVIFLGTHVGTHVDALGHVSHQGFVHGGNDVESEQAGGGLATTGIERTPPMLCRGVLLDIPATLGLDMCPAGYEITPDDLAAAAARQGTPLRPGDVALVRSGWGRRWEDGAAAFLGEGTGVPGPGEAGARWLGAHHIRAAGADTVMFEHIPADASRSVRPGHRVLLVESGINIIETLDLERIAADCIYEFLFCLVPLPLVGATGSPVRPLAIVGDDRYA